MEKEVLFCRVIVSENCWFSCFASVDLVLVAEMTAEGQLVFFFIRKHTIICKLTSFNLSMHFCPLGSLATATSGLSSGGGGCDAQLYSRFSSGTPIRSYCPACCLRKYWKLKFIYLKMLKIHALTSSIRSSRGKQLHSLHFPAAIHLQISDLPQREIPL